MKGSLSVYQSFTPRVSALTNMNSEEELDIQSELMFVNGMVHLPQEGNFGTPTSFPSPAIPPSSLPALDGRETLTTSIFAPLNTELYGSCNNWCR